MRRREMGTGSIVASISAKTTGDQLIVLAAKAEAKRMGISMQRFMILCLTQYFNARSHECDGQ